MFTVCLYGNSMDLHFILRWPGHGLWHRYFTEWFDASVYTAVNDILGRYGYDYKIPSAVLIFPYHILLSSNWANIECVNAFSSLNALTELYNIYLIHSLELCEKYVMMPWNSSYYESMQTSTAKRMNRKIHTKSRTVEHVHERESGRNKRGFCLCYGQDWKSISDPQHWFDY